MGRSRSSPTPLAVRAGPTRYGWPKRARTSSGWTSELELNYPLATREDLDETVRLVEEQHRRIIAVEADTRDVEAMKAAAKQGFTTFGRIEIILANAGILVGLTPLLELKPEVWQQTIGVNLTGHFHAIRAAAPYIIEGGRGGSIVLTASAAAMIGFPNTVDYTAAKTGVVGLSASPRASWASTTSASTPSPRRTSAPI
jgi:NAD(P)-dependent dehydrogenase (short-subunit alcohol dehydrogenase family)